MSAVAKDPLPVTASVKPKVQNHESEAKDISNSKGRTQAEHYDVQGRSEESCERRAWAAHAVAFGFTAAATAVAFRRGRNIGFRKLYHSVSPPKDIVYIGFLYGAGDVTQQLLTQTRRTMVLPPAERKWDLHVDWKGVATVTLLGASIFGPFNHYWYTFLDRFIKGRNTGNVLKKVLLDQLSLPIPICLFFSGMSLMRAKPDILEELKAKFLSSYLMGSILWPTAQFFNFMFVAQKNRVLFIGCVELIWTNILCFMKDFDMEKKDVLEVE